MTKSRNRKWGELLDLSQSVLEGVPEVIVFGQLQAIPVLRFHQPPGDDQELAAHGLQGGGPVRGRQAEPPEVVHHVEGEEEKLEEGHDGDPVGGRNLGQRVVGEQFADVLLDPRPRSIEAPDPPGVGPQVGHQDVIGVLRVREERELFRLDGIGGDGPADHHEAVGGLPTPRLILELSHLPAGAQRGEAAAAGQALDGGILLGHDGVAHPLAVEALDEALAEEAGIIAAHADPRASDPRRDLGQAHPEERDGTRRRHGVPRSQAPMPELLVMRLETEEGW